MERDWHTVGTQSTVAVILTRARANPCLPGKSCAPAESELPALPPPTPDPKAFTVLRIVLTLDRQDLSPPPALLSIERGSERDNVREGWGFPQLPTSPLSTMHLTLSSQGWAQQPALGNSLTCTGPEMGCRLPGLRGFQSFAPWLLCPPRLPKRHRHAGCSLSPPPADPGLKRLPPSTALSSGQTTLDPTGTDQPLPLAAVLRSRGY